MSISKSFPRWIVFFAVGLFVSGCGSSGGDGGGSASAAVGPGGGKVVSADGGLTLDIPPGALPADQKISIEVQEVASLDESIKGAFETEKVYLLQPTGFKFAQPVTVSMNLSAAKFVTGDEVTLPTQFMTMKSGSSFSLPANQKATLSDDEATVQLSGEIDHFSQIWDNVPRNSSTRVNVDFSGIPSAAPIGNRVFRARVRVTSDGSGDFFSNNVVLQDMSQSPVAVSRGGSTFFMGTLPQGEARELALDLDYNCQSSGVGTYSAQVNFDGVDFAQTFANIGIQLEEGSSIDYKSGTTKSVNCDAALPTPTPTPRPTEKPTPKPTPAPESSPTPSATPTATPTPTPTPTVTPTPTNIGLSVTPPTISFTHNPDLDQCPRTVGTVVVTNTGTETGQYQTTSNEASITVTNSMITLAPSQSAMLTVNFNCDSDGSFMSLLTVQATGTGGPLSSQVTVTGTFENIGSNPNGSFIGRQ